jgi:hypothetical protein
MSEEVGFTTRGARRAVPWTQLHDWVRISGISSKAAALYWVIKMHVYVRSGDFTVKITTDELAAFIELSRGDKMARYMRELEDIGAISSRLVGVPATKVYTVHEEPPDGYTGPLTLKEWYEMRKAVKAIRAAADGAKPQVNPVAPSRGELDEPAPADDAKPQVNPVAPSRGELDPVAPSRGELVAPSRGEHIQEAFEQEATTAPPPASSASSEQTEEKQQDASPPKPDNPRDNSLTDTERALFAECMKLRPSWSPTRLREVLVDPEIRDRPDWDLVRRAFLIGARTAKTQPGRMLASGCPHWDQALKQRTSERSAAAATKGGPDVPVVPRSRPGGGAVPQRRTAPPSEAAALFAAAGVRAGSARESDAAVR